MKTVIVYNGDGLEVMGAVSVKKSITMIFRNVANIKEKESDRTFGPYPMPKSIQLNKYIFPKWKYQKRIIHYSRKGVLERDGYICAYCYEYANTIDHVVPKCNGGASDWLNTVACCKTCNVKKAGRDPKEAGMKLLNKPVLPA